MFLITPRSYPGQTYGIAQLNNGNQSISQLELVSMISLKNIGQRVMEYYPTGSISTKYNPKIYISTQNTIAVDWQKEYETPSLSTWPEINKF